jgi:hypothetical protein
VWIVCNDADERKKLTPYMEANVKALLSDPKPHFLYSIIKKKKLPFWKLRRALGGSPSEAKLSRLLNGIDEMPPELEKSLKRIVEG